MPQLLNEETTDFSFGMLDSAAATRFPRAAAALLVNARLEADGTVSRRSGSMRLHPTALTAAPGFGGIYFVTAAGVEQLIVIQGGRARVSLDGGATWTSIASGMRQDYYDFATMRVGATNYLFAANGDTTIKRWDGTTWDTLPNAPTGVRYIEVFNGRLWAAGHSGVLVQASRIADPTTWVTPDGVAIQVLNHSTGELMGMYQIGPHLLVFDRHSTSYIDGYGEQTLIVASGATGFSRSVGCVAFRSIVGVGDDGVCWLSNRGIESYAPGRGITLISRSVSRFLEAIAWEYINANPGTPTAIYDAQRQNYQIAFATSGIRNNRLLCLNLRQNVAYQREGASAAATFDRYQDVAGTLLFGVDADGHLVVDPGGFELRSTPDGYMALDTAFAGGDPTDVDTDGYLTSVVNNTVPATLFTGPTGQTEPYLYSVGYDGFVRRHEYGDTDDAYLNGTPGDEITMTVVSRAFLFRRPRHQKLVRAVHISSIQDTAATMVVAVRTRGNITATQTVTVPATSFNQPRRRRVMVSAKGDVPQVEVRTSDAVRLALVGVSAAMVREPL